MATRRPSNKARCAGPGQPHCYGDHLAAPKDLGDWLEVPFEECAEFRSAQSKTGRNARALGIKRQGEWNDAAGFARREGHGEDGIYYGPDELPLLLSEHKNHARPTIGLILEALEQCQGYCQGERGGPLPVVGLTLKPGRGRGKARRLMILDAEDWPRVIERLLG